LYFGVVIGNLVLNQVLSFREGDIVVHNQININLGLIPNYTVFAHKGIMYMYFLAI